MHETSLGLLRPLTWHDLAMVLGILVATQLLVLATRRIVRRTAERAPSHRRLLILRASPIARLAIGIAGIVLVVPILVEPNFEEVVALAAAAGVALAFALKDYVSSLIAGVATIIENTYQPGDWIEIGGAYGEVKTVGLRAVHLVTADDTEVIVPHGWTGKIANASSGNKSMLCVADFYLQADHDGIRVCSMLVDVGESSALRLAGSSVKAVAAEAPWGTHYKLKVYADDSREQFTLITDLTVRAKARLRAMGVTFAQAAYAPSRSG